MTTDLMPTSGEIVAVVDDDELLDLNVAADRLAPVIERGDVGVLRSAIAEADALRLHEQRRENLKRANYFATVVVLAEAGIGVVSYDSADVQCKDHWRRVAGALERGALLDLCASVGADSVITSATVGHRAYNDGWCHVAHSALESASADYCASKEISFKELRRQAEATRGNMSDMVSWRYARRILRTAGVSWRSVPPAKTEVEGHYEALRLRWLQDERWRRDRKERERSENERAAKRAAIRAGGSISEAYSLVHRLREAIHRARIEATDPVVQEALNEASTHAHLVTDYLIEALGVEV